MLRHHDDESGFALVTAILAIAALSSLLVAMQLAARQSRAFVSADLQALSEETSVDAAISRVLSGLSHPNDPLWLTVQIDGPAVAWKFDGRAIWLLVRNTRSKIDLNTADDQQLARGLSETPFRDETSRAAVRALWKQARARGRRMTDVSEVVPPSLRFLGVLDALEERFTTAVPGASARDQAFVNASALEITAVLRDERGGERRRRRAVVLLSAADRPLQIVSWRSLVPRIERLAQR